MQVLKIFILILQGGLASLLTVGETVGVGDAGVAVGVRESLSVGQVDVAAAGQVVCLTSGHASASGDTTRTGVESLRARVSSRCSKAAAGSLRAEGLSAGHGVVGSEAAWSLVLVVGVCVGKSRALIEPKMIHKAH